MSWIIPVVSIATSLLGSIFGRRRNPNLEAIEERLRGAQETTQRALEEVKRAENARNEAERAKAEADRLRKAEAKAAILAREATNEANQRAENERKERERAEKERFKADQRAQAAEQDAQREKQRAEQETRAREDAERLRAAAEEAMERAKVAREAAEAAAEQAKIDQEIAERAAQEAMEETKKAKEDLANGIQPVTWPTAEEYTRTLKERQYQEGKFHFAIAGLSGSGKSSLVNAFRGVLNQTFGAAATGITETTMDIGRYPDPDSKRPFIWYDIPGAGTLTIKDWDYFNKQGLYIFDAIVVLFDNRFTATDIAILRNCARWKIPTFIVRSKSDSQIEGLRNTMIDKLEADENLDENEREARLETVFDDAVEEYTSKTRQSVKKNLRDAELEDQEMYLVSYKALLSVVRGRSMRGALYLDEAKLFADLVEAAHERRCPPASQEVDSSTQTGEFNRLTSALRQRGG